jgi:outer membrane protein assembly factor BamB
MPIRLGLRPRAAALVLLSGLTLSGCVSSDDISDTIGSLNPFAGSEERLPGERKPALNDIAVATPVKGRGIAVAMPAPRSVAWTQGGGPAGNNPGNARIEGGSGQKIWQASAGEVGAGGMTRADLRLFARPVAAGGRVFVYDPNGNVTALSADGGGRLWRTGVRPAESKGSATGGGVATDGAAVFAATGFRTVAALSADSGQVLWTKTLQQPAHGAPAVGDGKVFVVTKGNMILALNTSDGSEAWSFRGVPEAGALLSAANPAVFGGTVVVPFTSGELVALDVKTGRPVWTDALAQASRSTAVSGLADLSASPVIEDGVVYATGVGSRTAAFTLKTGQRLWEQPIGSAYSPAIAGNAVFVVDLDDTLAALDRKTGDMIWSVKLPVSREKKKRTHWAGPVLANGQLWLTSNEGGLIAVDAQSGSISVNASSGLGSMLPPAVIADRLLVLGGNGTLAAFN